MYGYWVVLVVGRSLRGTHECGVHVYAWYGTEEGAWPYIIHSFDSALQDTLFHATSSTNTTSQEISRMNHQIVPSGETEIWSDQIQVPSLPPSFLVGCSIIDINYYLEVKKNIHALHMWSVFCDNRNYMYFTVNQNLYQ